MSKYAITVTADNDLNVVDFDESNSYNIIKKAIGGGTFDCVRINSLNVDIWIDDEGKLVNEPVVNAFGSALWVHEYGMTDLIVGDIIITGGVDDEGKTLGLDFDEVIKVLKAAQDVMEKSMTEASNIELS
jgi:hypothetical protein